MATTWDGDKSPMETDTRPGTAFTQKKITSLSVMPFDAKSVQTYRGKVIDYVELGNTVTDDIIKFFYKDGKVRVTVGEYMDSITVTDTVEKQLGDVNTKRSEMTRTVQYKAAPFRKVDALINGRVLRFHPEDTIENSFIEIYIKVTDTYDGTVYWITKMRGLYQNVLSSLADTIILGEYTEHKGETSE